MVGCQKQTKEAGLPGRHHEGHVPHGDGSGGQLLPPASSSQGHHLLRGPRLLEALLLELVNLPINAGPMCAFMRRRGGPDKALPQAPGRQLCPRSWSVSPLQPRP